MSSTWRKTIGGRRKLDGGDLHEVLGQDVVDVLEPRHQGGVLRKVPAQLHFTFVLPKDFGDGNEKKLVSQIPLTPSPSHLIIMGL